MEEKVNIAEILKDKPQGTKLYDLLRNIDVKLDEVHITDVGTYIECTSTNEVGSTFLFYYSKLGTEESWLDGLQILLPSKEMRDWSKLAWNTGDILVNKDGNAHVIFEGFDDDTYETFNGNNYLWENEGITMCFGEYEDELPTSDFSKANKEDAQKYIRQIEKRLGYKLNFETLEIEKSEFKDGDVVTIMPHIGDKLIYLFKAEDDEKYYGHAFLDGNIAIVNEDSYCQKDFCTARSSTEEEKQQLFEALAKKGKAWDAEKKQIGSSGDYAQIGSSGYSAKIGSSGYSAKIGSSGDYAKIDCTGEDTVIMCAGNKSKAKAKVGSWITLAEWKWNDEKKRDVPVCVKTEYVDGENIKADTWYQLKNGKFDEL